jgi:hypothetical protein
METDSKIPSDSEIIQARLITLDEECMNLYKNSPFFHKFMSHMQEGIPKDQLIVLVADLCKEIGFLQSKLVDVIEGIPTNIMIAGGKGGEA